MPFEMRSGGVAGQAVSVSTQADIAHLAKGYESEDENAGRKRQRASDERPAGKTTMYSKQEFREQYCINNKQLDLLELEKSKKDRFLGCLSQYHIESPCSRTNRASFLSVCVRRRVPSDENLNTDYAPIQRYPRYGQPSPAPAEVCAYDADLECSYFRRRPRSVCSQPDPKRYTWMPEDEDFTRMEWPQSVIEDNAGWPQNYNVDQIASVTRGGSLPRPPIMPCPAHTPIPPPPPPPPLTIPPNRTKHVSFARSHTLTTFDDSVMPAAVGGNRFRRDCERLIDGRAVKPEPKPYPTVPVIYQQFAPYPQYIPGQTVPSPVAPVHYPGQYATLPHTSQTIQRPTQTEQPKVVLLDSIKKGVMRTQATQTEVCLGRKPLPPNYLSLSPRTIKRVKMVAAGVQTNGFTVGARRLTKSFSEVGGDRLAGRDSQEDINATIESFIGTDHEKLHRTQSEEPPRSPRSPTSMVPPSPIMQRMDSDEVTSSSIKSVTSSQLDKCSELSALQRQAQEYFQQNFQFIHESDRDDTIDDDIETIEKSMALNRRNLEYLQQEIAKQAKGEQSLRSILTKTTSDTSQKTVNSSHPFSKTSTFQSEPSTETSATTTDDSEKNEKEIIIDFEPRPDDEAIPFTTLNRKSRKLHKTLSEGEILLDVRKTELNSETVKDAPLVMSTSQENMTREDREREAMYRQYIGQNYTQTPIKDEGIFGFEPDGSFSSSDGNAPYEDFHEKYISYKHEPFRNRSVSFEQRTEIINKRESPDSSTARSSPGSPEPESTIEVENRTKRAKISNNVTTILTPLEKSSPCASNESLTVDHSRDHSDGMWNESQTTVLQVDSGTENGTVISSSDLSSLAASPGALALLTPTSRRKQLLLLQHQQRSSLDTDALDEEFDVSQSQSPTSPRNKLDTSSSSSAQARSSLSPSAVVPNITLPITKQPTISKTSPIGPSKIPHTPAIAITHPSLDLADVPFKRTPSFINKKRERALSPSRRKELQKKAQQKEPNGTLPHQIIESPCEAPLSKTASSDTSLARTDSGKINTTDVSESTTTTEDYVTANSDSSKKSGTKNQNHNPENNKTQEGSSFESASSLYSSTRTEMIAEDLIVPCFSPPLQISDDFIVPDLSSPPLPLPDRIPRTTVEKIEVKAEVNPTIKSIKRDKTEIIKPTEELPKITKRSSRDTISGKSSSSGSYSIGSNPNVTEDIDKTPTENSKNIPEKLEAKIKETIATSPMTEKEQRVPKMMGSLSDDERSVHYSSSGYYESPVEDEDDGGLTYKHSQRYRTSNRQKTWLEEKRRKKKAFTLEFSKSYDDSVSTSQDDWSKKPKDPDSISQKSERSIFKPSNSKSPLDDKITEPRKKKTHFMEKTKSVQSSPRDAIDIEKSIKEKIAKEKEVESKRPQERERYVKRTKLKAKSPTQSKTIDGSHGYRPQHYDRREASGSNMKLQLNIPTSDDSSEQYRKDGTGNGNISPRKHRRLRDSPRRKTGSNCSSVKSPTSNNNHTIYSCRPRKKSGSNESISLPGSLPRRKQSIPTVPCLGSLEAEDIETTRTLTSAGSRLTPLRYIKSPTTSPRHHRKQDKDGKFAKAASAESLRSVSPGSDSVFYSEQTEHSFAGADGEAKAHCLHCGKEVHIVTAPHEHDSRASRTSHTDESYADATPEIVPAPAGFADSPSCVSSKKQASGARLYKKLDKRYRSEDKTRHYRSRQDVRAKSEERGKEEYAATDKPQDTRIARSAGNSLDKLASSGSVDPDDSSRREDKKHEECSGSSEGADGSKEERGVYAAPWWCGNWILLSESDDHWTRIPPDVLDTSENSKEDPTESESEFNKRYVALTHRLVHRRACIELNRRQADNSFESDKTVVVRRGNEEFGFRIHGSKPVVVSAIEPDTPAETSGLEVGDIVIAVNGISVLDKTHSEVVKIAHSGSEILELDVARTCEVVASLAHEGGPAALYSGYLWRATPARPHHPPRWTRRWFVLKRDNCLYYYKTDSSIHPVGALMLVNYQLTEEDAGRPHGFRLQRGGGTRLQLAADNGEAAARWRAVLAHGIDASNQRDGWLEVTMRNMKLPPSSIPRPDCFGYLMKLGSKWKSWAKRYCVLKDACLYFYNDGNSKCAFGMACLHGYRIQTCAPGGKKYAFEVMPTEPKQRHFYFHTESEMDRKRWMAALEYSIDRWMKAG
ncbi:serine-rich adhesin for platelets isoform X3 [Plodia interpunctella]|uniref:serine-rich adhesin for platelets isoform X3 n=1 Tax=Plodia interpunctella TaxID=58824 RepID=UPI002367F391|nr:serine-rich adhesin for platelets isoform X3 [Plodia interpunctella]